MSSFLEALVSFLGVLPDEDAVPSNLREWVDLPARQRAADAHLEALECTEPALGLNLDWQFDQRFVEVFALHVGVRLLLSTEDADRINPGATIDDLLGLWLDREFARSHDLDPRVARRPRRERRWAAEAWLVATHTGTHDDLRALRVAGTAPYAEELRLASRRRGCWALRPAGRVMMRLSGPDRLRWLLHLEVAQSTGVADPWRLHPEVLSVIREHAVVRYAEGNYQPPKPAMSRWEALGLCRVGWSDGVEVVWFPAYSSLLSEVLADPPGPLGQLARSLSSEADSSASIDIDSGPDLSRRVTEAVLTHASMVKHELGNALVPLQVTMDAILDELRGDPERVAKLKARAKQKLDRLFSFAAEQVMSAALMGTSNMRFRLRTAIDEALLQTEAERNGRVRVLVDETTTDVTLIGNPTAVVGALVNLIRNAGQSRPDDVVTVGIHWSQYPSGVTLLVDDDGPGVPLDLRERIFDDGYSSHGRSGSGLALAKRGLHAMHGQIYCASSPSGGARFVIEVPVAQRSADD